MSFHWFPPVILPAYCAFDPGQDVLKSEKNSLPFHSCSQMLRLPRAMLLYEHTVTFILTYLLPT